MRCLPPIGVQRGGRFGPRVDRAIRQRLDAVVAFEALVDPTQGVVNLGRTGVCPLCLLALKRVEEPQRLGRPEVLGGARNLPLLPGFAHRGIQRLAQGLQGLLPPIPDDVDLGVVGDGLERDVGDALVDEAVADVASGRLRRGCAAGDLGLFELARGRVGEQVIGKTGAHDAGTGQRERHAGGVDGDPATTPLFGDIGGCAGAASWVEDEVARVGGHQNAALDQLCTGLYNVDLFICEAAGSSICPDVPNRLRFKVV
jgi:hypothetical protein